MATLHKTLLLLPFDDQAEHFKPIDAAGNLHDLGVQTGLAMPPLATEGYCGLGREFTPASLHGFVADDRADRDTITTRDATVQALVQIHATSGASWPRTIYTRGLGDGTSGQRYSLGFELAKLAAPVSPIHLEARLYWHDSSGTLLTQAGGTFIAPSDAAFVLLTATRRWESSSRVVCRYYVNGERIAEVESTYGDVAGATTGTTSVGARKNAGSWGRFFDGVIDELKVTNYEMSAEEVRATWDRLAVHQPAGLAALADGAPPGSRWGRDVSRYEGKLAKWFGGAVGYAQAKVAELRRNWFPHRADAEDLVEWEWLNRITPKPRDSLDTRRARVLAHERRDNGYAIPQVTEVLADPLDVDAGDLEIVNFTNTITDDFATTLNDELWSYDGGTWSIGSAALLHEMSSGATLRWGNGYYEPARCLMALSSGEGRLYVRALLFSAGTSDIPAGAMVGLQLFNWRTGDSLWWGVKNDAGTMRLGYVKTLAGVTSAFTAVVNPWTPNDVYLRIVRDPDASDTYDLGYSETGPEEGYTDTTVSSLLTEPEWAGMGAYAAAALGADLEVYWDDFLVFMPRGKMPFCWYAYRDPGLAGAPDMLGANAVARRLRPADSHFAVITSTSLLCDDDGSGCDLGPMGVP